MMPNSDPQIGDCSANGLPPNESETLSATREALQNRITALERDLALIQQGKEAAERTLRYERERARELAQNGTLSLKRDWVGLSNELKILKGEVVGEDAKENAEHQEAMVIDFVNRLRIGALAELQNDDDDTLYVKAKAYEIWYRACTHMLQGRITWLKVNNNATFEQTKKEVRARETATKIAKAADKEDRRRRTPEEKLFESLVALLGSEDMAREHIQKMNAAAKAIKTQ